MVKNRDSSEKRCLYKKECKYIGSIALTQHTNEDRQRQINEKFDEMQGVVKGITVVLMVSDEGIKTFKEDESAVKMAHGITRILVSSSQPERKLFAYAAKSITADHRTVVQAHMFKTKKAAHTKELNATLSKAFQIISDAKEAEEEVALVKSDFDVESFENRQSKIKGKRWAKQELARGHKYAQHAQHANRTPNNQHKVTPVKTQPASDPTVSDKNPQNSQHNVTPVKNQPVSDPTVSDKNQLNNQHNVTPVKNQPASDPTVSDKNPPNNQHKVTPVKNQPASDECETSKQPTGESPKTSKLHSEDTVTPSHRISADVNEKLDEKTTLETTKHNIDNGKSVNDKQLMTDDCKSGGNKQPTMDDDKPVHSEEMADEGYLQAADSFPTSQEDGPVVGGVTTGPMQNNILLQDGSSPQGDGPVVGVTTGPIQQNTIILLQDGSTPTKVGNKSDNTSELSSNLDEDIECPKKIYSSEMKSMDQQDDILILTNESVSSDDKPSTIFASPAQRFSTIEDSPAQKFPTIEDSPAQKFSIIEDSPAQRFTTTDSKFEGYVNVMKNEPLPPLPRQSVYQMTEEEILSNAEWYQAGYSREIAEALLQNRSIGSFFIRQSQSQVGSFVMTIKVPTSVKENGIGNFLVEEKGGFYRIKGFKLVFKQLSDLVAHYGSCIEDIPVQLQLGNDNKVIRQRLINEDEDIEEEEDEYEDPDYQYFSSADDMLRELAYL